MSYQYDATFNSVISTEGDISAHEEYLKEITVKFQWFTMAKMSLVKSLENGKKHSCATLLKSQIATCLLNYNYFNIVNENKYGIPKRFKKYTNLHLIENFINTPYKRKKPPVFAEDHENPDLALKTSENRAFVSEDLARIFVKQQLFNEAIDIYSKLILINPEKNVYFATCISELLRRIEEQNNE